jgi:hypothetical protein
MAHSDEPEGLRILSFGALIELRAPYLDRIKLTGPLGDIRGKVDGIFGLNRQSHTQSHLEYYLLQLLCIEDSSLCN